MKMAYLIGLTIIFLVCLNSLAYAEAIPEITNCSSIVLRTSEGWWLRINNDESGSYGFGTCLDKVEVKEDTFDFKEIYSKTKLTSAEKRKNAEGHFIAVSYYTPGSNSAREYYLSHNRQLFVKLLLIARNNTIPPSNEIEKRWQDSPLISSKKLDEGESK